jgi:glycine/D-amino acid oxidase-like deaminating enzyme
VIGSDIADVVVVGGGTVGAWTAVQLAERGAGRVILVESRTLGEGASSRAASPGCRVGITLNLVPGYPASPSAADADAARLALETHLVECTQATAAHNTHVAEADAARRAYDAQRPASYDVWSLGVIALEVVLGTPAAIPSITITPRPPV